MVLLIPRYTDNDHRSFSEFIRDEAKDTTVARMGLWTGIEYRKYGNRKVVRFMVNPDGDEMGSVTKDPSGEIHCRCFGQECDREVTHSRETMVKKVYEKALAELTKEALTGWDPGKTGRILAQRERSDTVYSEIRRQANRVTEAIAGNGLMPGGPREIPLDKFLQTTNQLLRNQIINPNIHRVMSRARKNSALTADLHNRMLGIAPQAVKMVEHQQNLIGCIIGWLEYQDIRPGSMEEAIEALREDLDLRTEGEWRIFKRGAQTGPLWSRNDNWRDITATCKILSRVDAPPEGRARIGQLMEEKRLHQRMNQLEPEYQEDWVHALTAFTNTATEEGDDTSWYKLRTTLEKTAATLEHHSRAGSTWARPRSWHHLVERMAEAT